MSNKLLTEHFFYDLEDVIDWLKNRKEMDRDAVRYLKDGLQNSFDRGFKLIKYHGRVTTAEETIEAIRAATKEACKSKESATEFLKKAGII